jgi:hypothetical protein
MFRVESLDIGLVAALERAYNVPCVRGVFSEIETVENN